MKTFIKSPTVQSQQKPYWNYDQVFKVFILYCISYADSETMSYSAH